MTRRSNSEKSILVAVSLVLLMSSLGQEFRSDILHVHDSNPAISSVVVTVTSCSVTGVGSPYITSFFAIVKDLSVTIDGYVIGGNISSVAWDWGDGETSAGVFPQTHTYTSAGIYVVTVSAFDCTSGGKTVSGTQTITASVSVSSSSSSSSYSATFTAGSTEITSSNSSMNASLVVVGGLVSVLLVLLTITSLGLYARRVRRSRSLSD